MRDSFKVVLLERSFGNMEATLENFYLWHNSKLDLLVTIQSLKLFVSYLNWWLLISKESEE